MDLSQMKNPTGLCAGCGESTHSGDHSECHLLLEDKHSAYKKRERKRGYGRHAESYKSGKNLPKWMYD